MNKVIKMICLILLLNLTFSCVEHKSTEWKTNNSELVTNLKADTLKFTSGIRAIFQDSKGNYWFGSHNEGVSFYDGKSFEYFTTKEGLADNQIRSIQEDNNKKIWFETAKGVSVYDKGKISTYSSFFNNPRYDWNSTKGDLWFYSTEEEGINRFDGTNMNYLIFPKPKNRDPYNTYGVTDISKAKDGKVWIATYAALFNYDSKMLNIFDHKTLKIKDNDLLHIRSVLADSKGQIWIGNNGIGVLLMEGNLITNFSEKNNLIHPTSKRNGDKSEPGTLEHVFAIEEDSEGNIWFGDRDAGIWKFDGKTMKNYTMKDGMTSDFALSIFEDRNNELWFGMADGSIYKFNGKTFEKQF